MKTLSVKRSFTIKKDLDETLEGFDNKSEVVNAALSIYFERAGFLETAENEFWKEKIEAGLRDVKHGRVKVLNADGGEVSREDLTKTLWS